MLINLVNGNRAVKTKIILGDDSGQQVVVNLGLKVGEEVVVVGQLKIHDGSVLEFGGY